MRVHRTAKPKKRGSGSVRPGGKTFKTFAALLEELEPIALGELGLTPEEFGRYTVTEIDAMFDGYIRRHERLEDLFIVYSALPTYRAAWGKKAPTYKKLTEHRSAHRKIGEIDEETQNFWRNILKGGSSHVKKHGDPAGN
jgi:hypothetical protein